ncbi:hypothetical protein [Seonamhaeicola sp.]|uniref:hypothetical protein n=1 Tax=Seonamhaeicola sp. TaxID=1912245 RepID=UPI00263113E7|nr:hypothetical protein [Seonamhaeicola sp.]
MESHYALKNSQFLEQFQAATLDPKLFTHEAHLRLAWLYIDAYGVDKAIELVKTQLINYVTVLGVTDKYNETVTVAAVKAVYHFYLRSESQTFEGFINEFPRLKTNFKDLLFSHYHVDIFNLEAARSAFLEPDLLPFD